MNDLYPGWFSRSDGALTVVGIYTAQHKWTAHLSTAADVLRDTPLAMKSAALDVGAVALGVGAAPLGVSALTLGVGASVGAGLGATAKALLAAKQPELPTTTLESARVLTEDELRALNLVPPAFCEKLVCFLVPAEDQESRLGDYEEFYRTRWLPKCGPALAKWCYVWHVIMDSPILVRIGGALRIIFRTELRPPTDSRS